jgi:hypothetical protein
VRFDVPLSSGQLKLSTFNGISVHALHPIQQDEEITLSYVDTTYPFEKRQDELKDRYFFTCTCDLCAKGRHSPRDRFAVSAGTINSETDQIGDEAEHVLLRVQSEAGLEHTHIEELQKAMMHLAGTGSWPLDRYPWPQLRQQLLFGLLGSDRYAEALVHSAILVRRINPILFEQKCHPIRLVQQWTFWNICRYCLERSAGQRDRDKKETSNMRMLGLLSCVVIDDVHNVLNEGVRANGQLEQVVDEALYRFRNAGGLWDFYQQHATETRETAWAWMDSQVTRLLEKEGVSQIALSRSH